MENSRDRINKDNCTGCVYCVDYCPENCLEMTGEGNIQVSSLVRERVCIGCALCAEICPHDAIQMTDATDCKDQIAQGVLTPYYIRNANEAAHVFVEKAKPAAVSSAT